MDISKLHYAEVKSILEYNDSIWAKSNYYIVMHSESKLEFYNETIKKSSPIFSTAFDYSIGSVFGLIGSIFYFFLQKESPLHKKIIYQLKRYNNKLELKYEIDISSIKEKSSRLKINKEIEVIN